MFPIFPSTQSLGLFVDAIFVSNRGIKLLAAWFVALALSLVSFAPTPSFGGGQITSADVLLSGSPSVGEILTANAGTWSAESGAVDLSYQWYRGGVPIPDAISESYSPTPEDGGQPIWVEVTGSSDGSEPVSVRSKMHLIAFTVAGKTDVKAWGSNLEGQTNIPASLTETARSQDAVALAGGDGHSLALLSNGTVVAWGKNTDGQATVPEGLSNVVAIAAMVDRSMALKDDGTVVVWGSSQNSHLNIPEGLSDVVAIASGGDHNLALKANGTVVAWGNDEYGQVRNVSGWTNVVAISAGLSHSAALTTTGALLHAGQTDFINDQPGGNDYAKAVSARQRRNLVVKTDGKLSGFGYQGNETYNVVPPSNASNVVAVATGDFHSLALKENGTVQAWGMNDKKQATIPKGIENVVSVAAGKDHSMVLIAPKRDLTTGLPTRSGIHAVGQIVSAVPGRWSPLPRFTYQWYNNGKAIKGATSAGYLIKSSDAGDSLKVKITGTRFGFKDSSRYSSSSVKVLLTGKPKIDGTLTVGSKVTINRGKWSSGASFNYRWLRDGETIAGATKSSYTLKAEDEGAVITVSVTGKRSGWATVERLSDPGSKVIVSAAPVISGSPKIGQTLAVDEGTWSDGTSFTYLWYANDKRISGQNSETLVLTSSMKGKSIKVKVTGSLDGFAQVTRTSSATRKVTN